MAKRKSALDKLIERANSGDPESQCWLAYKYYNGQVVEQNYKEAIKWFALSAEQGNDQAQAFLGYIYLWGNGIRRNHKTALKWFRKWT